MSGELRRRLVHLSGTGLPLLYLLGLASWTQLGSLLLALSAAAAALETLRLVVGFDWQLFDELTREYERDNPAAYALYVFSMTGVALAFPPRIAVPGMLMLSIGDPVSGVLGANTPGTAKGIGVLGAMFLVCFGLALPFTTRAAEPVVAGAAAAAGALGATLADGLKPVIAGYVVDDNLSIPPAACLAIAAVLRATGAWTWGWPPA